jgi:tmRNA-binding protein
VLTGTEVKSLRDGTASLAQAFATIRHGEAWLVQAHIPERGKAQHDKRASIAERDADRQMQRALRDRERMP